MDKRAYGGTTMKIPKLSLIPLGKTTKIKGQKTIQLDKAYEDGLKYLDCFSHAIIFYGEKRLTYLVVKILKVEISALTVVVEAKWFEENQTIYDIKPYFGCEDRIYDVSEPQKKKREITEQKTIEKKGTQPYKTVKLHGTFYNKNGVQVIQMDKDFDVSLLNRYSHVRVIWWFDRFDKGSFRSTVMCKPPYENAPKTGIFATRSPVRPNPIATTVVKLLAVDKKRNLIEISGFDGFHKSLILALVPYDASHERVFNVDHPKWLSHWPKWKRFEPSKNQIDELALTPSGLKVLKELLSSDEVNSGENSSQSVNTEIRPSNYKEDSAYDEGYMHIIRANQNNLKDVNLSIPKNQITVMTGVSGSGKSSLAFDTIYAESSRQFMDIMGTDRDFTLEKPDVDRIVGLQPAIAIEQKSLGRNPRSTVGTVTGIADYLRLLYTTIGIRHCPKCHKGIEVITDAEMVTLFVQLLNEKNVSIYPFGSVDETVDLAGKDVNDIETAVKKVLERGDGALYACIDDRKPLLLQTKAYCFDCGEILFDLSSSIFSYNNPESMCPKCKGLGFELEVNPEMIINHPEKSILDGASKFWGDLRKHAKQPNANWMRGEVLALADDMNVDLELPYKELPEEFKQQLLYGTGDRVITLSYENNNGRKGIIERPAEGAVNIVKRLINNNNRHTSVGKMIDSFLSKTTCSLCEGERLAIEGRLMEINTVRYPMAASMKVSDLKIWLHVLMDELVGNTREITKPIIEKIINRLDKVIDVGLSYLALDRSVPSLSGGEAQRLRLASQFGTNLTNILYVLDEPSRGLHPRDYRYLIKKLHELRNLGNTIVMVEHEKDMILSADYVVDIGPLAGKFGGEIIAKGRVHEVIRNKGSVTGPYLQDYLDISEDDRGNDSKENSKNARKENKENGSVIIINNEHNQAVVSGQVLPEETDGSNVIELIGARDNNLKDIDVTFPLNRFICVTGVSGSGKSSLISRTLYPAIARKLDMTVDEIGKYRDIIGTEKISKINLVSQQPLGRTPRSNPATYTGVFELIRQCFAGTELAKKRKYKKEHFSFNSKIGQCPVCHGAGQLSVEMHFMADIWTTCHQCKGSRYKKEILDIDYHGYNIADILEMDVAEALLVFDDEPRIKTILQMVNDVGLSYIKLGQSALTLSGGEAARIKLAKELSQSSEEHNVYILDEPTTGLHFKDIEQLLSILRKIVDQGNTVIAIEHNLDFINACDWIIDMGPEGGDEGGYIIASGTPESISKNPISATGQLLAERKAGTKK